MSWIKLSCSNNIKKGDVLSYDLELSVYTKASNMNTPLYVAMEDAIEDAENEGIYYAKSRAQGQVEAKCSRDIVKQGGFMAIENGAVYIDNNNTVSPGIYWCFT